MHVRHLLTGFSLILAATATAVEDLSKLLEPLRSKSGAPALGAIVIVDGNVQAVGAVGVRKHGDKTAVTIDDKWHIGSNTKSMTATLAATFVEEGKLTWDTTLGEVLKKIRMRDEYENVPLRDLLSHRSGIPGQMPPEIRAEAWKNDGRGNIRTRRKEFVKDILNTPPSSKPGTAYEYSNSAYIVAGYMLEEISGESWEALMEERLFSPLGMDSAGFGSPSTKRRVDQPWPHDNVTTPHPQGPGDDNPEILGPAGTVHASLPDLAKYVQLHLLRKTGVVLKKEDSFTPLHTNAKDNKGYALGWGIAKQPWADGPVLTHNGSNTMNYCSFWAAPDKKFAIIMVTNVGGDTGSKLCNDTALALIKRYAK